MFIPSLVVHKSEMGSQMNIRHKYLFTHLLISNNRYRPWKSHTGRPLALCPHTFERICQPKWLHHSRWHLPKCTMWWYRNMRSGTVWTRSQKTVSQPRPRCHLHPSLPRINSHLIAATVCKLKSAAMTLFQCLASRGLWSQTQAREVFFPTLTCPEQSRGRRLRDRMLPLPSKTTQTVPAGPQQPPPRSTDSFRGKVHPLRRGTVTTFAFFHTQRQNFNNNK